MSDELDPLERELARLKPRELSPELAQQVGRRVYSRWPIHCTILVAGCCAGVLALYALWDLVIQDRIHRIPTIPSASPPAPLSIPEESHPTLQAYRRAAGRSPEELDALLSKHASSGGEASSMHAFSRTELTSIGEP